MVALHLEVGYNESSFQLENNMILSRKSPMMMTHTGNVSSLQCQEVSRRKGRKELVVTWVYSVVLVSLV
jgi:hypothetical protein